MGQSSAFNGMGTSAERPVVHTTRLKKPLRHEFARPARKSAEIGNRESKSPEILRAHAYLEL
jgi:hypothetical protein